MSNDDYVTNAAWVRQVGRPDLVDEVADQFERPAPTGPQPHWAEASEIRWPRASRGWRSRELLTRRPAGRPA